VSGIVAGVTINRPSRTLPWLLLAAGIHLSFPSFADVPYLLTYPLCACGMLIFIRCRTPTGTGAAS